MAALKQLSESESSVGAVSQGAVEAYFDRVMLDPALGERRAQREVKGNANDASLLSAHAQAAIE